MLNRQDKIKAYTHFIDVALAAVCIAEAMHNLGAIPEADPYRERLDKMKRAYKICQVELRKPNGSILKVETTIKELTDNLTP